MPVSKFIQPDYTTQTATAYKSNLDAALAVAARLIANFAPRAQDTPVMTVRIDAGHVFNGASLTEVAAQSTGTITAPVGNPRIDRIVIDRFTGVVSVITGTPAASPVAPAITAGHIPVAQVLIQTASTVITNSMITDERDFAMLGVVGSIPTAVAGGTVDVITADFTPDATLVDNLLIAVVSAGVNTVTNPTLNTDGSGALTIKARGNAALVAGDTGAAGYTMILRYEATGTYWELLNPAKVGKGDFYLPADSVASAATTDIGGGLSNTKTITGTTGITSFGSSASVNDPIYHLTFAGALTITHHATQLILPSGANITTAAGDTAIAQYLGSGNWKILAFNKADGTALVAGAVPARAATGAITAETNEATYISPDRLLYSKRVVKAWVDFANTGVPTANASFNVTSLTDGGVGTITVNFTTAMTDANYTVLGTARNDCVCQPENGGTHSTTAVKVIERTAGATQDLAGSVVIIGN